MAKIRLSILLLMSFTVLTNCTLKKGQLVENKPSEEEKTAVLAWGSLAWQLSSPNYGNRLNVTGDNWASGNDPGKNPAFKRGGPILPIEYSSYTDDGRITLVIDPANANNVETLFALSNEKTLKAAIRNLSLREGCGTSDCVGYTYKSPSGEYKTVLAGAPKEWQELIHKRTATWLKENENKFLGKKITAVIWTDLPRRFVDNGAHNAAQMLEAAKKLLRTKPISVQKKALEYLKKAPVTPFTKNGPALEKYLENLLKTASQRGSFIKPSATAKISAGT